MASVSQGGREEWDVEDGGDLSSAVCAALSQNLFPVLSMPGSELENDPISAFRWGKAQRAYLSIC